MINRKRFFAAVRAARMFGDAIEQPQVDGLNVILDEWSRRGFSDDGPNARPLTQLAYVLATTKWETAHTMQPIREIGRGKGRRYGKADARTGQVYYGRGYVQLTWYDNYKRAGAALEIDLLYDTDKALDPAIAAQIMFEGMIHGWFAGDRRGRHTLDRHLNAHKTDWIEARRIINGKDKAAAIADIARQFHAALAASLGPRTQAAEAAVPAPAPPAKPVSQSTTINAGAAVIAIQTLNEVEKATRPVVEAAEKTEGLVERLRPALDLWAAVPDWLKFAAAVMLALWIIRERLKARDAYGR